MQVETFCNTFIVCDFQGLLLINPRNIIINIIMLLNINATRGPTDCGSATHMLLFSEDTGLWDAESITCNRGCSGASWTFTVGYFITLNVPLNGHPPSIS